MAITDKTRKSLWAKSGNRCLLCRIELVQKTDELIDNLIIGQECHIVSSKKNGPRANESFKEDYDHYDNLILLCANDHKRVDEQTDIYTTDTLKIFKHVHEDWVKSTLEKDVTAFINDKQNIKSLKKISSGKQIVDIISGALAFTFDHDELTSENEAEIIGNLFQNLRDYVDILSDIEINEVIQLGVRLNHDIDELKQLGFILFGLRRKLKVTNDNIPNFGVWNCDSATIIAVRQNNPHIVGDFLIAKFPETFGMNI